MSQIAFVFPGQGSQLVGMGQDLVVKDEARGVYHVFDTHVDARLSDICFNGPETELRRTLYTQPAILATALAALQLFKSTVNLQPVVVAGHSLGEYGALYAANVLSLEDIARLIKRRAELMEAAHNGAMSAILGLDALTVDTQLAQFMQENPADIVAIANYNSDSQQVISGTPEAVNRFSSKLKEAGAKRILPLPVGGAFHSPLMTPAAETFSGTLSAFTFQPATIPVISNVDAQASQSSQALHQKLGQQIHQPVRWAQSMALMVEQFNVDTVIEFGPGKVLTGLFKKSYPQVTVYNVSDLPSLEATCNSLNENALTV
jgi:[acyl-carrier-protein] S-malonyltransferase